MSSAQPAFTDRTAARQGWPPAWMFAVLILPQGIYLGFQTTALPFLLAKASVPVNRIAQITSLVSLPWICYCLWSPLVDAKLRRRTWLALAAIVTAVLVSLALLSTHAGNVFLVTLLSLGSAVAASIVVIASSGLLLTTLSESAQASASSWREAGKLSGSAVSGALILWLAEHLATPLACLTTGLLLMLPGLAVLSVEEPEPGQVSLTKGRILEVVRDIASVFRSPAQRLTALLLASPVGACAAGALLPAIATSYGMTATGVIWINGIAGGLVIALGSLCGMLLPNNVDRRLTYMVSGLANAAAAALLLLGRQPLFYVSGAMLYLASMGLCWARFGALVAEIAGSTPRSASARYSTVAVLGNLPLVYMLWLDGAAYRWFGVRGLLSMDAASTVFTIALAALLVPIYHRMQQHKRLPV